MGHRDRRRTLPRRRPSTLATRRPDVVTRFPKAETAAGRKAPLHPTRLTRLTITVQLADRPRDRLRRLHGALSSSNNHSSSRRRTTTTSAAAVCATTGRTRHRIPECSSSNNHPRRSMRSPTPTPTPIR